MSRRTHQRPNRVVRFTMPACPTCGGANLRTVRSVTDAEGAIRWVTCRTCGEKFTALGRYVNATDDGRHFHDLEVD